MDRVEVKAERKLAILGCSVSATGLTSISTGIYEDLVVDGDHKKMN
jgi:hypothetical protein